MATSSEKPATARPLPASVAEPLPSGHGSASPVDTAGSSGATAAHSALISLRAGNLAAGADANGGLEPASPAITSTPIAVDPARAWGDAATPKRSKVPEGLWMRCSNCAAMLHRKHVEQNLHVCPECNEHFRIGADERAAQLCDPDSFEPMWEDLEPVDTLGFADLKTYRQRLEEEQAKTGHHDAALCGKGFIKGRGVVLACLDYRFIAGSMGCVVGEKVARSVELAMQTNRPLIIVSASGGGRMQEGTLSLVQLSKTSAALARFDTAGGLYISVLADPTTGGVTASFAMLGDVILAEPKALIGFAGPRVIANTIRQELPPGFQRSEHVLAKGFIDRIVHRKDLRSEIGRIIDYAGK